MFSSIWDDIKREYSYGNMVTRLIIINAAVYVVVNMLWVVLRITNAWTTPPVYDKILQFFETSSSWWHNLTHPWAFATNLFLHEGFFHVLFNMLFLYWFGRIVGDFIGNHRILPLYLLSGLVGNLAFVLSVNIFAYGGGSLHYALGASGAVMGITVAAAVISPDYIMRLILLGDIKLKYIVAALVMIDLVGMAGDVNTGGHFAHLGGAAFGWFFVVQLREGRDLAAPVNRILNSVQDFFVGLTSGAPRRQRPHMAYKNPNREKFGGQASAGGQHKSDSGGMSRQERIDNILDKIKQSGYESLNEEEKEFLFKASKE